jgi:adenylate cyclase class 2
MNASQEIEVKFFVLDLNKIQMRLQELEAYLIQERALESNIRFDLPDNSFQNEGRVLRLRQDTEARLTYKGPSQNQNGILSRTEIEFSVGDHEKARQFLEALGYHTLFYYEKYRTVYKLGECHIMLDELPYGMFVEIEGQTHKSIENLATTLNLKWDAAIPTSYHAIFRKFCSNNINIDPADLSFKAMQGIKVSASELFIQPADEWS